MRKSIGKKQRFEVFKRDGFKCQYCGRSAPEVVLQADHIDPVVNGGKNDLLNLITSCVECNQGKGGRTLSDQSALAKQRLQLQELNERREQLEMMIAWKEGLAGAADDALDRLADRWSGLVRGFSLTACGRQGLRKLVRGFGVGEVFDAMPVACDQYLEFRGQCPTQESVALAWSKLGGVLHTRRAEKEKPWLRDLYYVRAVLRARVSVNEKNVNWMLEEAFQGGADGEEMRRLARTCSSWTDFWRGVEFLTAGAKGG